MAEARRGSFIAAASVLAIVTAVLMVPVIAFGQDATSEAADQNNFHLPVIRTMAEQWPRIDVVHYNSATAPGFHVVMSTVVKLGVDGVRPLRLVGSVFTLAMLLAAWWPAARIAGPWTGLILVAPLVASSYVLGAGIWLTTDNLALLFVLLALAGALGPPTMRRLALCALAAAAAVCVRQIHVWSVGAAMVAAFIATPWGARLVTRLGALPGDARTSIGNGDVLAAGGARAWAARPLPVVAIAIALCLPLAVVAIWFGLWGSLTPPALATKHDAGIRTVTPTMMLAVAAGFAGPLLAAVIAGPAPRTSLARVLAAPGPWGMAVAAGALSILPPSTYDQAAGRWGGAIWELVRRTPAVGGRSLVLIAGAAAGAWCLTHAWLALRAAGRGREALILAASMAGWAAAQSFNSETWQRYAEPLTLAVAAWIGAMLVAEIRRRAVGAATDGAVGGATGVATGVAGARSGVRADRGWWAGPAILVVVQLALLAITLYRPVFGGA